MKCISCGYFNLPQALTCGKCGMDLSRPTLRAGGSLEESLYPPRARDLTAWDKVQRRTPILPRVRLPSVPARNPLPAMGMSLRPWLVMTAALLPGAGHFILGDTQRGVRLLAWFFAVLSLSLLLIHSWVSDCLLWATLGLSLYSVWEVASRAFPPAGANPEAGYYRTLRLGFLSLGTVASTLASFYWLAGQRYPVYHLATDASAPGIRAGDDVIEQRLLQPALQHGDIVLARPADYPIIERILGLPGDRVDYAGGVLWVNGVQAGPERLPLSGAARQAAGTFNTIVPPGQVCLWQVPAGYYPEAGEGGGPAPSAAFVTFPARDIEGRVLGVLEPPAHRCWFQRFPPQ